MYDIHNIYHVILLYSALVSTIYYYYMILYTHLYRSVVAVGPVSASGPPTATLELALGIATTLLELLLCHLRWLVSGHHSRSQQSSPQPMHVDTNHLGALHPLCLRPLCVGLPPPAPGLFVGVIRTLHTSHSLCSCWQSVHHPRWHCRHVPACRTWHRHT